MIAPRTPSNSLRHRSAGFSLVELTIVVVILGVLAMMGVPRYQVAVEKAKASEAYGYLAYVAKAQEMYRARTGSYSKSLSTLPIQMRKPAHFSVCAPSSIDWEARWQLKLTRTGASSGFGAYSVAWCEDGFDTGRSSIPAKLTPSGVGGSNRASSGSGGGSSSPSPSPASPKTDGGSDKKDKDGKDKKDKAEKEKEKAKEKKKQDEKKEKEKSNNGVGNGEGGGRDGNRGKGGRGNG